jgi:murein DD-endopeptidase MepM/ murein hydrolase activator NlpD
LDLVLADSGAPVSVRFAPGLDFSPQERDTFLRVRFANPLPAGVVSSVFGYRNHPVTGIWSFHGGIDLAADFGTPVTVAADGVVSSIDRDPWLGLSVTVVHRASFATVYAHLQETTVAAGQTMSAGDIVGYVGSTGLSTGPHLHFEIRHRGESRNPEEYIQWDY